MLDKLKGAWEWIAAVAGAVVAFLLYGWWREQQGRQRAKAKAKVEKAKREQARAEKKIEKAHERQRRALDEADRLEERRRQRHEEAAREMGRTEEEIRDMSDEELADDVGRLLSGGASGSGTG